MSDRYSITNAGATDRAAATTQAAGAILALVQPASPTRRAFVYDLLFGTSGTAADNQLTYYLSRHTAYTATTNITPTPLDFSAPTSTNLGKADISAVTLTSGENLLYFGANQRSTQRWVAAPGSEFVMPATADDGCTFSAVHASATPNVEATLLFEE